MTSASLRRYRAERLLRHHYGRLRVKVIGATARRLAALGVFLDRLDLEACYAQAWHALYLRLLEGEGVENPVGWLVVVCTRRAVEEARSRAKVSFGQEEPLPAGGPSGQEAEGLERKQKLRQLLEGFVLSLKGRERQAATLCYLQGLSRAQAARELGISERRMRKLMEGDGKRPGVAAKVGRLLALLEADGWCAEQSSLMRAFAFGLLDPGGSRYAVALHHHRHCPRCRHYVLALRGLAALLPPPVFPLAAGVPFSSTARMPAAGGSLAAGAAGGGGQALVGSAALKAVAGSLALAIGGAALALRAGPPHPGGGKAAQHARRLSVTPRAPLTLLPLLPTPRSRDNVPLAERHAAAPPPQAARRTTAVAAQKAALRETVAAQFGVEGERVQPPVEAAALPRARSAARASANGREGQPPPREFSFEEGPRH